MINITPHWQHIQSNNPDIHIALQYVATAIYQNKEKEILFSKNEELKLTSAIEFGSLTKNNNKIAFYDRNVQLEYLARYAANLALDVWDNIDKFSEVFKKIHRHSFYLSYNYELCNIVLIILNQEHKKDITSLLSEIALHKNQEVKGIFWILFTPFCKVLLNLNLEPKLLGDKLEILLQSINGIVDIYPAVEKLAARSESDADVLYQEFLSRDNSLVINLIPNVIVGLASLSLPKAHNYALCLANSDKLVHQKMGIFALGRFNYSGDENNHKLLVSTLAKLKILQMKPNPDSDYILAQTYGNLIDQSAEALVAFLELASRQDDLNLKMQIAKFLYLEQQKYGSNQWYKDVLFELVKPPLLPIEVLKQLDLCLIHYANIEPNTALKLIEHLAINWDYSNHQDNNKLTEIFSNTLLELYNNKREYFIDAFTSWFTSNKPQLHLLAWHIQEYFDSIPAVDINENAEIITNKRNLDTRAFILSKNVIDNLDEQKFINLLWRMCGYIADGQSLAELLISGLRRESNLPKIQNLITSLLSDYVLYNYPSEVGKFLRRQLEINNRTELERNVIKFALESHNNYLQEYQKLPRLKELKPSSKQVYLLQLADWKYKASIVEKARQRSVFHNLFTNIPIKYGRGFSVEQNGEFTEPTKLKAFSYEQELPQGEFIDPVEQIYMRFQWRNIGLSNSEAKLEEKVSGDNEL